ncbi:MAG: sugar-binding domain-containing protein, partial [Eubacteriales bacterium]
MKRKNFLLDKEWKFTSDDMSQNSNKMSHGDSYMISKAGYCGGPGGMSFDDSGWREVDLPHDYFSETEFSPDNLHSHGYKTRGNGWYRKTFKLDENLRGCHFMLVFEGVSVTSDIYFNGSVAGRSFSAYAELPIDVTDRVHFGDTPNVLAVSFNGMTTEGWWYEGAGIYRHVRLFCKDTLHIAHNGIFVKPVYTSGCGWNVTVEAEIENSGYKKAPYRLDISLMDGDKIVDHTLTQPLCCPADGRDTSITGFEVISPELWD